MDGIWTVVPILLDTNFFGRKDLGKYQVLCVEKSLHSQSVGWRHFLLNTAILCHVDFLRI
jgi:hypothetical protein